MPGSVKPSDYVCPVCQGRGRVPGGRLPGRTRLCPECHGMGRTSPIRREQLLKRTKAPGVGSKCRGWGTFLTYLPRDGTERPNAGRLPDMPSNRQSRVPFAVPAEDLRRLRRPDPRHARQTRAEPEALEGARAGLGRPPTSAPLSAWPRAKRRIGERDLDRFEDFTAG